MTSQPAFRFFQSRLFSTAQRLSSHESSIPAAFWRGGTSKAVIFQAQHLPKDNGSWPAIFRRVLDSPDPNGRQLNGLGGGQSSTSKVCIVQPSDRQDADVDYTFAAIGVKTDAVDLTSNCGNMTNAIGPYSLASGLVEPAKGSDGMTVRIHNTNTGKIIHSTFPVTREGSFQPEGDFCIDGVAGGASRIQLDFRNPAGSKTGSLLPTGNAVDKLAGIFATCIDVGNPCVFVKASDLGIDGATHPDAIEKNPDLLANLEDIRKAAAVAMGISADVDSVPSSIPKIAMITAPMDHRLASGKSIERKGADVIVRAMSVGQAHGAVPLTVAMALAAAATIRDSVAFDIAPAEKVSSDGFTIAHPSGTMLVGAKYDSDGAVESARVFGTARRLMEGHVYL